MTLPQYLSLTTQLGLSAKEAMLSEITTIYDIYKLRFEKQQRGRE